MAIEYTLAGVHLTLLPKITLEFACFHRAEARNSLIHKEVGRIKRGVSKTFRIKR